MQHNGHGAAPCRATLREFEHLFDTSKGSPVLVVTFIALLELAKEGCRHHPGRGLCAHYVRLAYQAA